MKFCLCESTYILVIGALLVLIHTCLCMKFVARKMSWYRLRTEGFAMARNFLSRMARFMSEAKESKELTAYEELVMRKREQRRAEISGMTTFLIANVTAAATVFSLATLATENEAELSEWQIVCLLCSLALSICAYSAPQMTPRLSNMYLAGMMIMCTTFLLSSSGDGIRFSLRGSYFIRFVLSVSSLNVAHMVFWNLAAFGATCICTATLSSHELSTDFFLSLLVSFDIMATVTFIVVSMVFERWIATAVGRETEITKLQLDNSSSMSLLDMMCDVVLELSDKLKIVRESRNFGALMLNTSSSLQGQSFVSFIADEFGRDTFQYQLIAGTRQDRKVGVCNTTLLDRLCNRINVEVFFVKVEMDVDACHYLCGVRESNQENIGVQPSFAVPDALAHAPSKRRGTPPTSERSDLSQIRAPSRSDLPGGPRNPLLKLTDDHGRCLSLETCLSSWNISTERSACCSFHAYIAAGKRSLSTLAKAPCRESFPAFPPEGLQCQTCGIIIGDADEDEHDTCPACDSIELGAFLLDEADAAGHGDAGDHSVA